MIFIQTTIVGIILASFFAKAERISMRRETRVNLKRDTPLCKEVSYDLEC